jgi:3-oxoacyl-[acyl-carrier protein] reductase
MSLDGKVALVTGASRGIGQAIAMELARAGAKVIGTATGESGVSAINQYLSDFGGRGIQLDVTDTAAVERVAAELEGGDGMPDILVNNAGVTRDNLIMRMSDEEWYTVINTNLTAVYTLTKTCLRPMFRKRWGRIINISSVIGATGNLGQANYAAAKAGLIGFSKSTALEVASRNITVNVIAPGFIDTDMTRGLPDQIRDEILKRVPAKRLGDPQEIGSAVAFLASPQAAYITGETLHINGGLYMG